MYLDYAESEFEKYIDSLLQSDKDCDWKYIKHYYLLENEVQKMYKQYDKICEKERKL